MSAFRGHRLGLRAGLARAREGRPWRALLCSALTLAATEGGAEIALPSGQSIAAMDRAVEVQADGAHWLVLRFLAPQIGREPGDLAYDAVLPDLDALCAEPGLRVATDVGPVDQIVVVLLDRDVPRGVTDPKATQYISAYAIGEQGCEWQ